MIHCRICRLLQEHDEELYWALRYESENPMEDNITTADAVIDWQDACDQYVTRMMGK